jgi:uncharacterized protein (DUF362 family)
VKQTMTLFNVVQERCNTRRSSRYQPFWFQIATDDTLLQIEARMTQMGRSCKVIQKTGKTVLLHPNVLSIALKWSRIKPLTHPRVDYIIDVPPHKDEVHMNDNSSVEEHDHYS